MVCPMSRRSEHSHCKRVHRAVARLDSSAVRHCRGVNSAVLRKSRQTQVERDYAFHIAETLVAEEHRDCRRAQCQRAIAQQIIDQATIPPLNINTPTTFTPYPTNHTTPTHPSTHQTPTIHIYPNTSSQHKITPHKTHKTQTTQKKKKKKKPDTPTTATPTCTRPLGQIRRSSRAVGGTGSPTARRRSANHWNQSPRIQPEEMQYETK